MSALPIREEVIEQLKVLSDEQVAQVLDFIQSVRKERRPYSEANDPMLSGELFFSGSEDLSEQSEEILEADPAIGFFSGPPDLAENSKKI